MRKRRDRYQVYDIRWSEEYPIASFETITGKYSYSQFFNQNRKLKIIQAGAFYKVYDTHLNSWIR